MAALAYLINTIFDTWGATMTLHTFYVQPKWQNDGFSYKIINTHKEN